MVQYRDDILLKKIAKKLRLLRNQLELTLEEVYNDIDVHVGRIESGNTNISVSTLAKICKYYKISLVDFFKDL